jgi:hypothetical protein
MSGSDESRGGSGRKDDGRASSCPGAAKQALQGFGSAVRAAGIKVGPRWQSQLEFVEAIEAQESLFQQVWPDSSQVAEALLAEAKAHAIAIDEGNEHRMYVIRQKDRLRAVKITLHGAYGKIADHTPVEYMRRLAELAEFDRSLNIHIVGLAMTPSGLGMVTDMAFVAGMHPKEWVLQQWLKEKGFVLTDPDTLTWSNSRTGEVIRDAKPENFIQTDEGMSPIDVAISSPAIRALVEGGQL